MPKKLYPHTQFCTIVEGQKVRYYGIDSEDLVPPGFSVGDKVKLCINTDESGHLNLVVTLQESMFNPLQLNGIGVVDEDGLWTVIHENAIEGGSNVSDAG